MMFIRHDAPFDVLPFHGERLPWRGGDLQTMRNTLLRIRPALDDGQKLVISLPDGDSLLCYYHQRKEQENHNVKGLVILIHGLAGDHNSSYVRYATRAALANDYAVLRVCLRGAGDGASLAKSSYHAGRQDDIAVVIQEMSTQHPKWPLYIGAYSLGGTMAVNLVSRRHDLPAIKGVISFCAPLDMTESSHRFHQPRNKLYNRHFTKSLIKHELSRQRPSGISETRLKGLHTVRDYDEAITCHIAGYGSAADYYEGTSAIHHLAKIQIPTLLIHSDNDPLIPVDAYLKIKTHSSLFCAITKGGGHVGFHDQDAAHECWQAALAMQYFNWLGAQATP